MQTHGRTKEASALTGSKMFLDNRTGDDVNIQISMYTKQKTAVMLQLEQYFNDEKVLLWKILALLF